MQQVRRLLRSRAVVGAALTLCVGFALTACRQQPSVAAYVGDHQLTEQQVDDVMTDSQVKVEAAAATPAVDANGTPVVTRMPSRTDVVATFVFGTACEDERAKKPFDLVAVTGADVAGQEGVPADSIYAQQRAKAYSCLFALKSQPITPNETQLRDIYDKAIAAGTQSLPPYDQVKAQIAADTGVQQALGHQKTWATLVNGSAPSVNPRYRPLQIGIEFIAVGSPIIVASVADESAVHDLPAASTAP